jgi:hypothetical protein
MTSIGLHRLPARCGMHLIVDGVRWSNPTIGRQDKSADRGRAHVVGGIEDFAILWLCLAGALGTKVNDFKASTAVAGTIAPWRRP